MRIFSLALLLLTAYLPLSAQTAADDPGPIATDRPSASDGPYIVPKGYVVIETGLQYQENNADGPTTALMQMPTATVRCPLSERFELRLAIEQSQQYTRGLRAATVQNGLSPIGLGFKVALSENRGWIPKTAFLLNVGVPKLASRPMQTSHIATTLKLAMQNSFGEHVTFDYNLGAAFDGETAVPTYFYTANLGYAFNDRWACFAELYGDLPAEATAIHSVDAGVTFVAWYNILLDLSAGYGLSKDADNFFVGAGFSIRLPGYRQSAH